MHVNFKLVKQVFSNYLEAYMLSCEHGPDGTSRDIKQIEKALDNRLRYLNNKIKRDNLFQETNGEESFDSNLNAIMLMEDRINKLQADNERLRKENWKLQVTVDKWKKFWNDLKSKKL